MAIVVQGINECISKLSQLDDAKMRREMVLIFARTAKIAKKAATEEAPMQSSSSLKIVKRSGKPHAAGTLKKSISIFRGKSKTWPNVHVGAAAGKKKKHDVYYAHFVSEGHKTRGSGQSKQNKFMERAKNRTEGQMTKQFEVEFKARVNKIFT